MTKSEFLQASSDRNEDNEPKAAMQTLGNMPQKMQKLSTELQKAEVVALQKQNSYLGR